MALGWRVVVTFIHSYQVCSLDLNYVSNDIKKALPKFLENEKYKIKS